VGRKSGGTNVSARRRSLRVRNGLELELKKSKDARPSFECNGSVKIVLGFEAFQCTRVDREQASEGGKDARKGRG